MGGRKETHSVCHLTQTLYKFYHFTQMDSLHVRCFEEVGYERDFGYILRRLESTSFSDCLKDVGEVLGFSRQYEQIY